ncbi:putative membrane protein YesL [Paenarthrobacter nitroguajacolicus]|nr:hypothetical protein [Paenarthrobacter nitroguajacolicus]MDR6989733.1 putative membrane protein YesL [Paenarthrobacter nitroguajacolicus]
MAGQKRRRWAGPRFETFGSIFGFIYTFLAGNALLAVANAPLVLSLSLVADPAAAWPFFLALSVTLAPSLAGIFAAFKALNDDGDAVKPVAAFLQGYKRSFAKAAVLGVGAVSLLMFLGVDLALVHNLAGDVQGIALLVPLIVVAAAVTVSLAVTAIAGVVLLPEARLKSILKASLYLVVQRWYLSLAMLILLGIIVSAAVLQPVLGIALAPAPLLFVIWSNASYAFHAVLRPA